MAPISNGLTFDLPNYVGELFSLTPADTPFVSMIGGMTGGRPVTSKEFTWQTVDNAAAAQSAALEGDDPTYAERARTEVKNVCQIFQYGVQISYTKQAATGQLGDGAGTPVLAATSIIGNQPVQDEAAFQMQLKIERAARDMEYTFLNGTFAQPNDNATARKTRGIITATTTNATVASSAVPGTQSFDFTGGASEDLWTSTVAHGLSVGDEIRFTALTNGDPYVTGTSYWVVAVPSSTTYQLSATKGGSVLEGTADGSAGTAVQSATLSEANLGDTMQAMYDNGAPFRNVVLFVNSHNKRAISDVWGYAPDSRSVGGVNILDIETDFGRLGVVLDRHVPADTILLADLSVCAPRFLTIPGKGHFFSEPLAQSGAAWKMQLYGEVGLEYGPEIWHGKITGLTSD
ncbi:MAG: DUF5309 domain-containing protein [Thermoplasmata archaeon]|nr:DUF5309 domain-containing protein [Thermoplasmata archaeon]NIT80332.1 DUF5309 domain-containing protein [Thermoplasmata archaeon]NIY06700.1 hypothetical protein [Thermoplasmata archaeon]